MMRRISTRSLTVVVGSPDQKKAGGGLLLTLLLAFLVCVLVVGGARMALAQATGQTQSPAQDNAGTAPPAQLQQPQPKITASCDSTAQTATVNGTGWIPGRSVNVSVLQGQQPAVPDGDGNFSLTISGGGAFTQGRGLVIQANQPTGAGSAMTSTSCQPGGGETTTTPTLTASCDLATQTINYSGKGWKPNTNVAVYYPDGNKLIKIVTTDADGAFALTSQDKTNFVAGYSKTVNAYEQGSGRTTTTTEKCSETTTPGGGTSTTPGGGGGGGGEGGSGSGSGGVMTTAASVFSGLAAGQLPDTGGGWAILLIAGAILIALGWLLLRLARRLASAR